MKANDLDRIRFVTRHLGDLQAGVTVNLPLGLNFLAGGLAAYFSSLTMSLLQLASLVGFVLVTPRLKGYLEARFGVVEQKKWSVSARMILVVGLLLACLLVIPLVYLLENSLHGVSFPTIRLLYLIFGAVFLFRWIYLERRLAEAYNLVLCALFLVIVTRGAFPTLAPPEWLLSRSGVAFILWGSAMILTGLLDYWRLARTLQPLAAAEEPGALAAEEKR